MGYYQSEINKLEKLHGPLRYKVNPETGMYQIPDLVPTGLHILWPKHLEKFLEDPVRNKSSLISAFNWHSVQGYETLYWENIHQGKTELDPKDIPVLESLLPYERVPVDHQIETDY